MPFFTKFFRYALHCQRSCWCGTTSAAKKERAEAALFDLYNTLLVFLVFFSDSWYLLGQQTNH